MALVHRATLTPSKQELVAAWLPSRPWARGQEIAAKVAEYRFDDPAGEVGVETILWQTSEGTVLQTPLTYRAAPLEGAEQHLVGTSEHSVLGPRWVYDGCADPVWAATLATAIATGATQAQMYFEENGKRIDVPPRMTVRGSGSAGAEGPTVSAVVAVEDQGPVTRVRAGDVSLLLARVVGTPLDADATLSGRVGDEGETLVLAGLQRSGEGG